MMKKRWLVIIIYKSDNGPDWNTIFSIYVTLNPERLSYETTVEQAPNIVLGGGEE